MRYTGEYLKEISFPLGGIGTGSIGLSGNGELRDWEIFNRPNKGSINSYSFFALRAEYPDGRRVVRVLQGDHTTELSGRYEKSRFSGFGFGPAGGTMCGFPHFDQVVFDGRFPVAELHFSDPDFPAEVTMTAYNPMIPHDAEASGIPAAFFDLRVTPTEAVTVTAVLSVRNPFAVTENRTVQAEGITGVQLIHSEKTPADLDYGDLTVAVDSTCGEAVAQTYWYRGKWMDPVATFWHEISNTDLTDRSYDKPYKRDVCSVASTASLTAGEDHRFSFVIAWNVPNNYNNWTRELSEEEAAKTWKNYYATRFADSSVTAEYALANRESLYGRTALFCELLHSSTLDPAVIDAAASSLAVLKSPTVWRLEDGTFYGWEGVHENAGSCEGTCTHVWSYAYGLCFLFPELERSIRNAEFRYSTEPSGKMEFRLKLPIGRKGTPFHPCVDGQMASVVKTCREWKISGDSEWLRSNWETVKRLLDYASSEENEDRWDADRDGILEGRQHHTLDMELFGPSAWLEGMYLAALRAAMEMAEFLEDREALEKYSRLFEQGYAFTRDNLFNGSYFVQRVELGDHSYIDRFECPEYWNEEQDQLKYQIGEGCEIDQLLGQWHAGLCGLGDVFDADQRRIALKHMYRYLFKPSMKGFANAWRVFALNEEGGAVMCDYPKGAERPVIPIPYSDECMTGFEYALAGQLIGDGYEEEGLSIVRAIRDRYDGAKRNPWNEIECGSNYARAMASFALLPIFSGMEYNMAKGYLGFCPRKAGEFSCFFSVGSAFGSFSKAEGRRAITLAEGSLTLSSLRFEKELEPTCLKIDGRVTEFESAEGLITFAPVEICHSVELS